MMLSREKFRNPSPSAGRTGQASVDGLTRHEHELVSHVPGGEEITPQRLLRALERCDPLVAVLHGEVLLAAEQMIELVADDRSRRLEELVQAGPPRDDIAVRQRLIVDGPQVVGQQESPDDVAEVTADQRENA